MYSLYSYSCSNVDVTVLMSYMNCTHSHADCCTIMVMVLVSYICMSLCLYVIMSFMSLCSFLSYCNVDCHIIMVVVLVL